MADADVRKTDTAALLQDLEEDGFVVLKNALTPAQTVALRTHLQANLDAAIAAEKTNSSMVGNFATIHTREKRHDLRLPMDAHVQAALTHIVGEGYPGLYQGATSPDARLVELGVIASHPSAQRQTIHSDVEFSPTSRRIFTTFVALQDVTDDMGPTEIWPGMWCH
jgi:hypothetical protein